MNHTYRVVYNEATNTYAAVAENVPARGKSSKSKQALAVMVAAALQMTAVSAEAAVSIGSTNGNSISSTATAGQASSVAIGKNACATNSNTIAIGDEAQAIGVNATAIANASNATGINSIAIGFNSTASAVNATALGTKANASGDGAIAFGANATAGKNITFGTLTYGNHHSIAIGTNATAEAQESVVLGHNAKALGVFKIINDTVNGANPATVVIGNNATSRSNRGDTIVGGMASNNYNQPFRISQSTIIGSRSRVFGDQATALGSDTSAIGNSSFAIGGDDFDSAQNSIEKALDKYKTQSGYTGRSYTSLDKTITDKVNALTGNNASAVTAAIGNSNQNSDSARRQYVRTAAIGDASIAFGTMAQAGGVASIAEGTGTIARGDLSVALGPFADTYGKRSIAIGALAKTSDDKAIDAISIGTNSTVSGNSSIAIGTSNLVTGDFSGAIGDPSVIAGSNSYSIGNNNVIANNTDNAIALGGQNSVGGTIARTSLGVVSDVNASNISNVAGANRSMILGYNNTVNVDDVMVLGSNINVTTRKDSSNNNILVNGSVILGQNASTESSHPITNVTSATVNGITYGTFAGKVSDTGRFVSVGAKGDERKIINVAAGNISATSTEAINGSQLYTVTGVLSNLANTTAKGFGNNSTVNQDGTITPKINYGGNTYNNVEDALNNVSSTWKIANNNVTATEVNKTNNTVSLDNSSTITVKQNGLNFEFNANTTGLITNTTTGKVETPANGSNLVNATEVVNAINNSGFTLNTTNAAGGEVSGSSDHLVKPGSKVVVDAGKNIAIKQDNGTISIATTENVSFNNVNASNVTVGPVTINKDGINAGNKPITNVSNGTNGTDAVNLSQLNATKTKVEGDKGITVTPTVSATDGSTTYKVTADTTTVTHTGGKVDAPSTADSNKLLNATEVANAINNSGFNVNAGKAGTGNVDGNQTQLVKPGDEVKFIAGDNLNLTQNGSNFTYSLNKDVNLTTEGSLTVGPVTINKDGINAGNKPITNVSNGTNGTDAVNLSQLNATKTKVEGDKGITVTPTVSATDGSTTYKVTADTTTVTHTGGKVATPTGTDGDKLLNATEVANAINNSGFNVNADKAGTGNVDGNQTQLVKPGDEVKFIAGDNLNLTQNGSNFTYSLNKDVNLTTEGSLTVGPVTINKDGINAGNKPITNVSNGTNGTDAVNLSQLNATKTKVEGDKGITVTPTVSATDGSTTYKVTADTTTVTHTGGKVATPTGTDGDKLLNATEVANAINNSGFNVNADKAGTGNVDGNQTQLVKPGDEVKFIAGDNLNLTQNGSNFTYSLNKDVNLTTEGSLTVGPVTINKDGINAGNKPITNVSNGTNGTDAVNLSQLNATKTKVEGDKGITVTPTVSATDGSTTYKVTADTTTVTHTGGKVATPTGTDGDKLLNATEVANAINNSGFNVNAGKAGTGNVDGNQTQLVKPGDEVKFIAGDNLNLTQNGSNFTYSLNKDVNLTTEGSLTVGPVSINKDGINAGNKPITNVSNGTNGTDAVNLSQLNATKTKVEGDKGITVTPTVSATDGSTTYKVTADTTTVTHTGGKVDAPSTADSNKLLNATEVANAINNSGFNLSANGTNSSVVNPGELVDLNNTDGNIVISKKDTDNNVTFNLNNVVKVGDNSTTATTNNHPITIDGNNGTVSGLVNNLPDTYNQDAYNTGNKANTTAQPLPSNLNVNNAATVGDVLNAGWNLQENGGAKDFVKAYDTVNFVNGAGTTANVTVNANGTVADVTYNVNADGKTTEITYVDNAGNTVYKQPNGTYNTKKDGSGSPVNANNITGSQISAIKGTDTITSLKDGNTTTIHNAGNATAPNYVVEVNKANVTTTPTNTPDANNVTINKAGKVVAPTNSTVAGNTFLTAKDVANVINNSGFSVTSNQTTGGNVSGSTVEMINPGETITYIAGKNINITQAQNNFTFATADDVAFRTINMGGQINMGGDKIINLAPGTNATDAATVGQLPIVRAGNNINVTTSTENGTTVYTVHTGNVTGGNGITITPTTNTTTGGSGNVPDIKVSVNTTTLTPNTNGTISAGTNASTSYATAANVANAINNSGFTLNTTASAGDVSGSSNHLVKPGSTVTADAGKNIALTQNNGTVSVATKDNVTFSNVNVGPVSINNATGINAGNLTITNVAPGVNSTDAVNVDQLKQNITNIQNQIGGNTPNATLPAKSPYITTYDAQGNVNQLNPTLSNAVINTNEQGTKYFHTNDDSLPQAANHSAYNNYDSSAYGTNSTAIGRNAEAGVRLYHANGTANNVTKELSVIKTDATGAYQTDANGMVIRETIKETRHLTSGAESIAQGHGAKAISNNSIAIGIDAQAGVVTQEVGLVDASGNPILDSKGTQEKGAVAVSGENAVAIGNKAQATANETITMGYNSTVSGEKSIAVGENATVSGAQSISIGVGNTVTGNNSGAFGDPSYIAGTGTYAIGNNNTISTDGTFVIGNTITNTTANSVFLGTNAASFNESNQTGANGTHVADGAAESAYTYRAQNDAQVKGVGNNSAPVGVVSVGNANETRQIQGVAAGVISANSTDAINGSQLYYTNEAIGNVQNQVNHLGNRINQVADDADAGTASAMATATLPQAYLPGKSMVAVGTSTYRGKQGYAVGFSAITDSGNWIIKGTASGNSKGHFGATVGAGYQW